MLSIHFNNDSSTWSAQVILDDGEAIVAIGAKPLQAVSRLAVQLAAVVDSLRSAASESTQAGDAE